VETLETSESVLGKTFLGGRLQNMTMCISVLPLGTMWRISGYTPGLLSLGSKTKPQDMMGAYRVEYFRLVVKGEVATGTEPYQSVAYKVKCVYK